jgi:23S rRNA (cytidine1920-2'-O)/16S rRNA (cytidine1409-2'-O)-methyltransferase
VTKPKKVALIALIVERGLFADAEEAKRWVLAGQVFVNGRPETKAGTLVPADSVVTVRGRESRYVSRAGAKLEWALNRFGVSVGGLVALDAGASVGGFTDCLLQHGARKVFAVDVGFGQIRGKLAADPRVVNLERTNISDLDKARFVPPIDLAVVDLSYLSLSKAVPELARLFVKPVAMICLVKPLFEGVPAESSRDLVALEGALRRVAAGVDAAGLTIAGLTASPIPGTQGTIEFLALIKGQEAHAPDRLTALVAAAIDEARAVPDASRQG